MEEIDSKIELSEDRTEMRITLSSPTKLSNEEVIMELEYLIHQLSQADDQKRQLGGPLH
jgi:hypothetical protein